MTRDPIAVEAFVERLADEFVRAGMPRMPSRAFAAVLGSEESRLTAAELGGRLQASPAAISTAMRYLEAQDMVRRTRVPGERRDVFTLGDDIWYEALTHRDGLLRSWAATMAVGADATGRNTPAGIRLAEMEEFFLFIAAEMPDVLQRWRDRRDRGRAERGGPPS